MHLPRTLTTQALHAERIRAAEELTLPAAVTVTGPGRVETLIWPHMDTCPECHFLALEGIPTASTPQAPTPAEPPDPVLAKLKLLHDIFRPDPDELGDEYHSGAVRTPDGRCFGCGPRPRTEREYEAEDDM